MSKLKLQATDGNGGTVSLKGPASTTGNAEFELTLPGNAGSNGQLLSTNGSGVLTWTDDANAPEGTVVKSTGVTGTTKYLRADGDNTCSWQTVTSVGGATGVDFNDNVKARWGTGNDLEIYHSGTHSFIKDAGTGNLQTWTNQLSLLDSGGTESMIQALENGAVELYYDNSKKFETTSAGATVTGGLQVNDTDPSIAEFYRSNGGTNDEARISLGAYSSNPPAQRGITLVGKNNGAGHDFMVNTSNSHSAGPTEKLRVTSGGNLKLPDSAKIELGGAQTGSGDLQIYHSTNNYFDTKGQNVIFRNRNTDGGVDENMISMVPNGGVYLYHDGNLKCSTYADGLNFPDVGTAAFGAGNDMKLYHYNGVNYIQTGNTTNIEVKNDNETMASFKANSSVDLFADNVKKLQTNSTFGTILSNTTDDANYTNVLTLARRGYEISGYGVNFKVKGGSSSSQNGLKIQVSDGSGYNDKFSFDNDGLKFGSDSAAANGLSDYEEGTFTPTLYSSTGQATWSYSAQTGTYTKVGRVVTCHARVHATVGGTENGYVAIGGLPFTSASYQGGYPQLLSSDFGGFDAWGPAGIGGYVSSSGTSITLTRLGEFNTQVWNTTNWNNSYIYFSVSYEAA